MSEEQFIPREAELEQKPERDDEPTRELGEFAMQNNPGSYEDATRADIIKDEAVAHAINEGELDDVSEKAWIDHRYASDDPAVEAIKKDIASRERFSGQLWKEAYAQHKQRRLDERINVYEEIYDSNPDRFANMPTSEFIEFTRQFESVDEDFADREQKFNEGVAMLEVIDKALENKQVTKMTTGYLHAVEDPESSFKNNSPFDSLLALVAEGEGLDDSTKKSIRKKFDDIRYGDEAFDKSPRQILTEERELVENLLEHGVQALVKKAKEITDYAAQNFGDDAPMAQRYSEIASVLEKSDWVVTELRELVTPQPQGRGAIKVS